MNTKENPEEYYTIANEQEVSPKEECTYSDEQSVQSEEVFRYEEEPQAEKVELRRGFQAFYLFPLAYVLSPLFSVLLLRIIGSINDEIGGYNIFLPIVFGVINIVACIRCCKPENRIIMLNSAVLVKCALIPVFILGGFIILVFLLLTFIPVPFMIFAGPAVAILCLIIGVILLIFGAPYTIAYLVLSVKAGIRSKVAAIIHGLLQFCFTVDVIDVMVLAVRERKWIKLTICLVILAILAVILGIAGIIGFIAEIAS